MNSLFNSGVNHAAQVLLIKNPTLSLVFYRFSGEYLHPNNSTTHLSNVLEYATHPFCLYKTWLKNNGSAGSLYNCRNINFRFFCKKLLTTQQTIKSKKRFADGGGKFVDPAGRSSNFLVEDLNSVFAIDSFSFLVHKNFPWSLNINLTLIV